LPEILCLLGAAMFKNTGYFGEAVNDLTHLWTKISFDVLYLHLGIFNHIVEQRRNDRSRTEPYFVNGNLSDGQRMENIWLPRFPSHFFMSFQGSIKCLLNQFSIPLLEERFGMPQ